jgi:uncharacterized protein YecE (DUF72 family)
MQDLLFPEPNEPVPGTSPARPAARGGRPKSKVQACPPDPALGALRDALPPLVRLGGSSWSYPGWRDLVWDGDYADSVLSRHGLSAYAAHPLLRTVSLDRAFYRPLSATQYAALAAQVDADFRFMVKAPSLVTDATVRDEGGRGMQANPAFLSPELAVQEFVQPALAGLGEKVGALVFQLSPLPAPLMARMPEVLARLEAMLRALPALHAQAPEGVVAVEVRDPAFLTPAFATLLRDCGATFCLGVHPKMPPIAEQLPVLRALWPGPLVCRWNTHRMHGAYGYEDAERRYQPFDRIVDDDPATRAELARVIAATARGGQRVYVSVSNQAEGCAPRSIAALAQAIVQAPPR